MRIGFGELLVVFIVALLVLGPDKMPEYARRLGVMLREFRDATSDATKDIRENVIDPLNEAQRPLREALEPLTDIKDDIDHNVNDIKHSLDSATSISPTKKVLRKNEATGEIEEVPLEEPAPAASEVEANKTAGEPAAETAEAEKAPVVLTTAESAPSGQSEKGVEAAAETPAPGAEEAEAKAETI